MTGGLLFFKRKFEHTDTQPCDDEDRPTRQGCRRSPENLWKPGKRQEAGSRPHGPGKDPSLLTPWSHTSHLLNCDRMNLLLKPPVGCFVTAPKETNPATEPGLKARPSGARAQALTTLLWGVWVASLLLRHTRLHFFLRSLFSFPYSFSLTLLFLLFLISSHSSYL